MKHHAELWQNGRMLAERDSTSPSELFRDMGALARCHEPDGPTEIRMNGKVWQASQQLERRSR